MQLFEVLTAANKEAHEIAVNSLRLVVDLRGLTFYQRLIKNAYSRLYPFSVSSVWSYI